MKIGILTFHDGFNFGALLQAYALKTFLNNNGHDAVVINYHHRDFPYGTPKRRKVKNRIEENAGLKEYCKACYQIIYSHNSYKKYWNKLNSFSHSLTNYSKQKYVVEEELEKIEGIDAWIVGSDQIWNPDITMGLNRGMFLDFNVGNARKITYAASMGIKELPKRYEEKFKEYLNNIDFISVREQELKEYAEKFTNKPITRTIDPTLLLKPDEYKELEKPVNLGNYILTYTLGKDDKLVEIVKYVAKELNLKVIEVNYNKKTNYPFKQISNAGPDEFISLVKNAKFVLSNSFHGTVFSLVYKKPFYTVTRSNRNSRMESLLNIVGLQDRLIKDISQIELDKEIDYEDVHMKIEQERKKSIEFLNRALKIEES